MECSKEFGHEIKEGCVLESHILSKLETELKTNLNIYKGFVQDINVDILEQFRSYKDEKKYNTRTGDTLLLALCNCFNVEAIILESDTNKIFSKKYHISPSNAQETSKIHRSYYLVRSGDHYDALVIPGSVLRGIWQLQKALNLDVISISNKIRR